MHGGTSSKVGPAPVLSTSYFFVLTYVLGFSGEIPVALLRWKFVEYRTVELKGNAGLMLPSNICELGDSVTKIDLSNHNLRGELSIRTERLRLLLTLHLFWQENYPSNSASLPTWSSSACRRML